MTRDLQRGDYVLASKYSDGDPFDGFAVGWFDTMLPKPGDPRFMVVDSSGKQYRGNGFRRAERITEDFGNWFCEHVVAIEALTQRSPINLWRFKYGGPKERAGLERWIADEGLDVIRAYIAWNVPKDRHALPHVAKYLAQIPVESGPSGGAHDAPRSVST